MQITIVDQTPRTQNYQVRFSAVQVMDALFMRSHLFRTRLLDTFTEFVDLTCGLDIDKDPLPRPAHTAKLLRRLALLRIHNWHAKFGQSYRKLALGYEWLKNTWRVCGSVWLACVCCVGVGTV